MRLNGPCAPWLFEGPMNGEMFLAWLAQGLAPTLQKGDLVILDNLATHKIQGIVEAIAAAGARLLYRPPYSPDFNPIENMWSKIKQILRSQAPRTESELLLATKAALQAISTADCKSFFFDAKYAICFMEMR
jgi:transposase